MSADYAVPTSWEDLLADEKQRRLAQEFLASGGVTSGAEDRAPYAWETDGTRRPEQDSQTATNFQGMDLVHQSMPTTTQNRFQSIEHALKSIPANTLASFAAGTDANMRRVLGEPVAQVAPAAHASAKPSVAKADANKTQKSTDAASPESRAAQKALLAQFKDLKPEDVADVPEAFAERFAISHNATLEREGRKAAQDASTAERTKDREQRDSQFAKRLGLDYAKMDQDERLALARLKDAQDARDASATAKAAAQSAKDAKGQTLPAGEAASLGTYTPAISALDDLAASHATLAGGIGGQIGAVLPISDTDAKKYNDKKSATAQAVGTILEGGKLAAGDEVKYDKMLPTVGDSPDRRARKIENVKKLLRDKYAATRKAFAAAGYNVKDFTESLGPPVIPQRTTPDKVLPKDAAGNLTLDPPPAGKVRVIINGKPMLFPVQQVDAVKKRAKERGDKIEVQGG